MDPKSLETLEFPKVLAQLASFASFSGSRELALALRPTDDLREAVQLQQETGEARRLLEEGGQVRLGGVFDIRPYLDRSSRSATLLPHELLEIRTTLQSARRLQQRLTSAASFYPRLADIAGTMLCCPHVISEIGRCIDDRSEVRDIASPELASARKTLRQSHEDLLSRLQRIVASARNAPYLQEALVTQRQGRYVIPLRADFRGRIPGIVHDESASGATLFIEPLSVVELGNSWRQGQLAEEREIQRVLLQLTELVAEESQYIANLVATISYLDLVYAKARYAESMDVVQPRLVGFRKYRLPRPQSPEPLPADVQDDAPVIIHPGVAMDLRQARHPLLEPDTVVPTDLLLDRGTFVLVITGPNTGGKTVALKTTGLLCLMAQSGLAIPADEGSLISVLDGVYADIGDEQSIEQSLSTFSSHMTNIVRILHQATSRSLVILDELGAGTDPEEGSSLARALISHLTQRSITTLTATHYSDLKAFAHVTPGVQNASVEFDAETLSPTFELSIGLPGRSNALAIARRLGLPESILDEAGELVKPESWEADALLEEIRQRRQAASSAHEEAARKLRAAEAKEFDLRFRLNQIEIARREVLNEARSEARELIEAAGREIEELRVRLQQPKDRHQEWLAEAEEVLAQRAREAQPLDTEIAPLQVKSIETLHVGERVWIPSLQASGEVLSLDDAERTAALQIGSFHLELPWHRLRLLDKDERPAPPASLRSTESRDLLSSPGTEIHLLGMRVEDMLPELRRYLDQAHLSGLPSVRIVHGKGTGRLRQATWDLLRKHPNVAGHRLGEPGEGGHGVTIATMVAEE